ncbi:M28 family peptidase [Actinomadura flavalba]|uniref:M28 family peptidase n=1 Tax=Actinomadura flavalba TaxID=1120938 RepID=UPI00037F5F6B|nr:M28 family peptidase [Actinomadura flavalba]
MRRLALGAAAALIASLVAVPQAQAAGPDLAGLVKPKDVKAHLKAFQEIADYNGGSRATGTAGFELSVKYVVSQLKRAGFTPSVQKFDFDFWEERGAPEFAQLAPDARTYAVGTDFNTMAYSGNGEASATAVAVDVPAAGQAGDAGCEASDFAGFTSGSIALIQRGTCDFVVKARNAEAAGASAVVIYNRPDQEGIVAGTLGAPVGIPVVTTPYQLGEDLVEASDGGDLRLRVKAVTYTEKRTASNVIAETKQGRADNVVVVGAHLDSVNEGPGINDNGTGSAAILAIAQKIGQLPKKDVRNKVRFAWWGAEEEGLLGSEHYVAQLSEAEAAKIALNLNFDMLGSINGITGVYDGDDSLGSGTNPPLGSGAIEKAFKNYYAKRKLPTVESPFTGRSDYGPFIAVGIPAGGLFSGAEGIKTAEEARLFGGTAGQPYDPCYHAACDTLKNIDWKLLEKNTDGAAAATQQFAGSTLPVNGEAPRKALRALKPAKPEFRGHHAVR